MRASKEDNGLYLTNEDVKFLANEPWFVNEFTVSLARLRTQNKLAAAAAEGIPWVNEQRERNRQGALRRAKEEAAKRRKRNLARREKRMQEKMAREGAARRAVKDVERKKVARKAKTVKKAQKKRLGH
jgi:hypothetical protein